MKKTVVVLSCVLLGVSFLGSIVLIFVAAPWVLLPLVTFIAAAVCLVYAVRTGIVHRVAGIVPSAVCTALSAVVWLFFLAITALGTPADLWHYETGDCLDVSASWCYGEDDSLEFKMLSEDWKDIVDCSYVSLSEANEAELRANGFEQVDPDATVLLTVVMTPGPHGSRIARIVCVQVGDTTYLDYETGIANSLRDASLGQSRRIKLHITLFVLLLGSVIGLIGSAVRPRERLGKRSAVRLLAYIVLPIFVIATAIVPIFIKTWWLIVVVSSCLLVLTVADVLLLWHLKKERRLRALPVLAPCIIGIYLVSIMSFIFAPGVLLADLRADVRATLLSSAAYSEVEGTRMGTYSTIFVLSDADTARLGLEENTLHFSEANRHTLEQSGFYDTVMPQEPVLLTVLSASEEYSHDGEVVGVRLADGTVFLDAAIGRENFVDALLREQYMYVSLLILNVLLGAVCIAAIPMLLVCPKVKKTEEK